MAHSELFAWQKSQERLVPLMGSNISASAVRARDIQNVCGGEVLVALAGNPNVGKSTLFNLLTGLNQHTGIWSGKTVELASGRFKRGGRSYTVVDLPGAYSLNARSAEEEVAREFLLRGDYDIAVAVCDATCLRRSLMLALEAYELTGRLIICVNLMDEAERAGVRVDTRALEARLGIPVVGISAGRGKGVEELLTAMEKPPDAPPLVLDYGEDGRPAAVSRFIDVLCDGAVTPDEAALPLRDRGLDRLLTSRVTGYPVMALALAVVLWLTVSGANYPSALLQRGLFWLGARLLDALTYIGTPWWLRSVLIDGIYRTLAWVVSVMLPPMAIFFPLFTLLEDLGFLPRVAFNLDRPFKKCSACGKQALTMCMGLGCNAAGVVGCRIIESPRERLIAILTNSFTPCNGRFPALIAILTMFFAGSGLFSSLGSALLLTALMLGAVFMTLIASKLLSKTLLRGMPSSYTLELPPYRRPQIARVLVRSLFDRTLFVLRRAVIVAAPAGLLIWLMANLRLGGESPLAIFSGALDPFARLLGLDGVILLAFILALPANEIVIPTIIMCYMSAGSLTELADSRALHSLLTANGWTRLTALCALIFFVLHWPCSTTLITVKKETGSLRWTAVAALLPALFGMLLCAAVALAARLAA